MKVPFINLKAQYKSIKKDIDKSIKDVVNSTHFIMGDFVLSFEDTISQYLESPSLGVASGSDSLLLSLMATNIKEGDEVITTPFTFFATAGAIVRLGAKPVFVDIEEDTYNIDPKKIEAAITKKTKAMIIVHIYGKACEMDTIMAIAKKHYITVIEDACQAIGARYKGRKVGTIGDFGCFSFFPSKNLGAYGDGGLVTCKNPIHYDLIKKLRVHGSVKKYIHEIAGINSRLDALQAAILQAKLPHIDEWNRKRIEIAKIYNKAFADIKDLKTPVIGDSFSNIFHLYTINTSRRDELISYLKDKHVDCAVYYPEPLHLQKCFDYLGYKKGDLPVSEKLCERVLSIPVYPEMTDIQINYVVKTVRRFFKS